MGYPDGVEDEEDDPEYVLEIIKELQAEFRKERKLTKKLWRKLSKKERHQIMLYCDDVRVDIHDELVAADGDGWIDMHMHVHLDGGRGRSPREGG